MARRSGAQGESNVVAATQAPVIVSSAVSAGSLASIAASDSIVSGTMKNAPTPPVHSGDVVYSAIAEGEGDDEDSLNAIALESSSAQSLNANDLDSVFASVFDELGIA